MTPSSRVNPVLSCGPSNFDVVEMTVRAAPAGRCVDRAASQRAGSTATTPSLTSRRCAPSPRATRAPIPHYASSSWQGPQPSWMTCARAPPPAGRRSGHPRAKSSTLSLSAARHTNAPVHPFVGAREHSLRRGAPPRRPLCGRRRRQPLPATQEVRGRLASLNAAPDEPSPCATATHSRHPPRVAGATARLETAPNGTASTPYMLGLGADAISTTVELSAESAASRGARRRRFTSLHFTTLHFTPRAQPRRRARLAAPAAAAPRQGPSQARCARALCPLRRCVAAAHSFLASSSRLISSPPLHLLHRRPSATHAPRTHRAQRLPKRCPRASPIQIQKKIIVRLRSLRDHCQHSRG